MYSMNIYDVQDVEQALYMWSDRLEEAISSSPRPRKEVEFTVLNHADLYFIRVDKSEDLKTAYKNLEAIEDEYDNFDDDDVEKLAIICKRAINLLNHMAPMVDDEFDRQVKERMNVLDTIEERNNLLAAQLQQDELIEFQEAQAQFEDWEQFKADELAKEKYMEEL